MAGAIVTHYVGVQGTITLHTGHVPARSFEISSGPGDGTLPFGVALEDVEISYYPGTTTPMDFKSILDIDGERVVISMNRVGEVHGWRFYQTGIGADLSTVSISHDPWGIGITYTGYALLLLGMAGYFFQRNTAWRAILRSSRRAAALLLIAAAALQAQAAPSSMQRPLASRLGKVYVYWNDRVCPLQTMARDVTVTLYGSETYKGLTAEQVLSGWLFYFDEWHRDYLNEYPEAAVLPVNPSGKREKKLVEKIGLIQWLGTGEAFRIYPYLSAAGNMEWLSLTGHRPSGMSLEQWTFMQSTMPRIKELLLQGKNIRANEELDSLKAGQIRYAGAGVLPSAAKLEAERAYNRWARPAFAGIAAFVAALLFLVFPSNRRVWRIAMVAAGLLMLYLSALMGCLWWISGHLPLSNGPETMLFMGLAAVAGSLLWRSGATVKGCLCAVGGLALMVAAMAGRTPRIGMLMPVLSSPLLSVHVMVVMTSYVLFMLMALLSGIALCTRSHARKESLSVTNLLLLTPAVCLLGAGIFIGAVWANQSWGRYWGWDPKETCALVTWFVYALPAHWACRPLRCFRRPKVLHLYLLLAILCVAFTYFGANYLLPGLHSYA
ncbi:MAG: cytochrome c biogenesis protein CcsA [Muribaculaceae bacterium]|nr:cytochrome c biogenesis protein CcsA [Muribaculaceae bacterium]